MLKLKNILKVYSKSRAALKDINLTFPSNGLTLIIGPSGSGKSTLLNIIGGLDDQTRGSIYLDDKKITKQNIDAYRNTNIGFVFQEMNLISSFTLQENLRLAFDLCGRKMTEEEVVNLLKSVGLPDDDMPIKEFLAKKPYELSVGQMQRVAIARALVKDPKILLLDEPTSALDEGNAKNILQLLKELSKTRSVIISSHDKNLFLDSADQIIQIENGIATVQKECKAEKEKTEENSKPDKLGFFSFLETFRIALFNLKNKKIRLFSALVITTIVASLFGAACILQTYDQTDVLLRTQTENNQKTAAITRFLTYHDQTSVFANQKEVSFEYEQLRQIAEYTDQAYSPIWLFENSDSPEPTTIFEKYIPIIAGYAQNSEKQYIEIKKGMEAEKYGLLRYSVLEDTTVSRLPQTMDEVAISGLYAELLVQTGFMESDPRAKPAPPVVHVSKVDELIGHKISNGLTIVGIFSTDDGACETLKPYLTMDDATFETNDDYNRINSIRNSFSLARCMYVIEGYHSAKGSGSPYTVFLRLKGDYEKDREFIKSFEKEPYYIEFVNYCSGFATVIGFSGVFQFVSWVVIVILLIISFFTTLSLFYGNVKSMEYDLSIFKTMGACKWSISLIVLCQSLIVSLTEYIITLIALGIFAAVVNARVSLSLLSLNATTIFLLLLIVVVMALLVSLLSARKAVLQKPKKVMKKA